MNPAYLLNSELSWHNKQAWNDATALLELLFKNKTNNLESIIKTAKEIKDSINRLDSFIQQNTSSVCPTCESICCINKHGYYDFEDLVYIYALGIKPPQYKEGINDTDPCQFLSRHGCTINRSIRPFRCNWYFCSALLKHMDNGPAKPYREFIACFQKIVNLRNEMLKKVTNYLKGLPNI